MAVGWDSKFSGGCSVLRYFLRASPSDGGCELDEHGSGLAAWLFGGVAGISSRLRFTASIVLAAITSNIVTKNIFFTQKSFNNGSFRICWAIIT